jgi:hypothetical protein
MDPETLTRERAYLLWQQAGCPEGRSEEFWFAAIQSIAGPAVSAPSQADGPAAAAKKATARRRAGAAVSARTGAPAPETAVTKSPTSAKSAPSRADMLSS